MRSRIAAFGACVLMNVFLVAGAGIAQTDDQVENLAWDIIQDSDDSADFVFFLKRFPNGIHADAARRRLRDLGGEPSIESPPREIPAWVARIRRAAAALSANPPSRTPGCYHADNHCMDGRGTYVFPNGDRYSGDWRDGKQHGFGLYVIESGDIYEGEWSYGLKQGRGREVYANDSFFEGEFADNSKNGFGTFYYNTGIRYEGGWRNGLRHGAAVLYRSSDAREETEWRDDRRVE